MIELKVKNNEEDYLLYSLYLASKSKEIAKNIRKLQYIPPIFFAFVFILSYFQSFNAGIFFFGLLTIAWPINYRKRSLRGGYTKVYRAQIKEQIADSPFKEYKLVLTDKNISLKSIEVEANIDVSVVRSLIELPNFFIIMIKQEQGYLISKKLNPIGTREILTDWAEFIGVEYLNELDWKLK